MNAQPGQPPIPQTQPLNLKPPPSGVPWWAVTLIGLAAFGVGVVAGFVGVIGVGVFLIGDSDSATAGAGGDVNSIVDPVGSCFRAEVNPGFWSATLLDLGDKVPCEEPHEVELYVSGQLPGSRETAWHQSDIAESTDAVCRLAFRGYTGLGWDESDLEYLTVIPSKAAWAQGDRDVHCFLYDPRASAEDGSVTTASAVAS